MHYYMFSIIGGLMVTCGNSGKAWMVCVCACVCIKCVCGDSLTHVGGNIVCCTI